MNFSDLKTYCKDPKNRNTVNVGLFIVLIISFHFLYLGWQAIGYWPVTRWVNDLMVWSVNLLYGQCCWVLEHVFRIDITTINAQRLIAAVNKFAPSKPKKSEFGCAGCPSAELCGKLSCDSGVKEAAAND